MTWTTAILTILAACFEAGINNPAQPTQEIKEKVEVVKVVKTKEQIRKEHLDKMSEF